MNIRVNNDKNTYARQGWGFQPISRPGLGKITNVMISNPPKDRKLPPQPQNNNSRKPNSNALGQQNENQTVSENILAKRFSNPSPKLLPEIQASGGHPVTNVPSKQSILAKLENEDYDMRLRTGKSGSAIKATKLSNSNENLQKLYENIEKDLELYTENRVNELFSKNVLDITPTEKRSSAKFTKTNPVMAKPISQITEIEKKIVLGRQLAKSNTNLAENYLQDSSPLTNDTSQRTSKPPLSGQSRRAARQRTTDYVSGLQNKTQGTFDPSSINEIITTEHDRQYVDTAEKIIFNDAKIILGPIGRNAGRSHTQNGIRDVMNTSIRNMSKTPDRARGILEENKTAMNPAPKERLKMLTKPAIPRFTTKPKRTGDATESTSEFLLGSAQRNDENSEGKFRMEDYVIEKQLGQGSYAVVKLAREKRTGQKFAIKTYEKFKLYDATRRRNVKREISLLQDLDHPNIIKLHHTIENTTQINLVMEMGGQTSLHSYLKSKLGRRIDEQDAKPVFKQIVQGMKYLHGRNIAHRDIKLDNILLDEEKRIKIIDFGFSVLIEKDKTMSTFCGTPSYMAPELANKKDYNGSEVDVWAMGVVLYAILAGKFPFKGENDRDLYKKIARGTYQKIPDVSAEANALIGRMLRVNPQERPTAAQILEDCWFIGLESSHVELQNFITEKMAEYKTSGKK